MEIVGNSNMHRILRMYDTALRSPEVEIRGSKCRNIRNAMIVFQAGQPVITSFYHRKLNLNYAKREWLWYLGADKFDDSIMEHATAWAKLKQEDGSFHSNYGQYIFAPTHIEDVEGANSRELMSPFIYVVRQLKMDKYSRRASIVLLQPYHLTLDNTDTVCTYAINFTIADDRLHMTVHMRSNDIVFGFTNDAFCFWNLYEFVYRVLTATYKDLQYGDYVHIADSLHVYERHYGMLRQIVMEDTRGYRSVDVPRPTAVEVIDIVTSKGKEGHGDYFKWLTTFD